MTNNASNSNISVDSISTIVLGSRQGRKFAILVNDSDETIYVSLGATAEMNKGIRLNANGGALEINVNNNLYTGIISAICASGSKNLTITEAY